MKRLLIFFLSCLIPLGLPAATDSDTSAARAARRVVASPTTSRGNAASSVPNATTSTTGRTPAATSSTSRGTSASVTGRGVTVANVESRTATRTPVVSPRDNAVQTRTAVPARTVVRTPTTATSTTSRGRSATTPSRAGATPKVTGTATARTAVSTTRDGATSSRAASSTTAARAAASASRISRAAALDADAIAQVTGKDYKKCRTIYYECMDEFCANKDSQLKRCACSARAHDFDSIKKRLTQIEDKMLDFNQRLLTVSMDKEDTDALFTATEGELAFQQQDTSASKKMLDEIAAKLKKNSADAGLDRDLTAISLTLNTDAAFDNIDSMLGADTVAKEGTALYNAALPVCREMAAEVCDDDALDLAVSGYLMMIEQDCTTVSKAYETQNDQAIEKIREGSALLDMSRLDVYQKQNSDDILTCKKKMLTMLSDSSVCGENLGKCLDTTGQYIDSSTGEAFLTVHLADLGNLLTRPTGTMKWTDAPGNAKFITYLNSKKKYLEPAMENCQDVADTVWNDFIEDALSQIKLAQENKLEEMRQSCTKLTTQCLTTTSESLSDFDARALSIFGVSADKTVNEMCSSVKEACTALLDATGGADTNDWETGMTDIATDTTYDTIMKTCREVGRNCIIQSCKSISGNFGLCENIDTSINRKSIINRTACWPEVLACVDNAGNDSIKRIYDRLPEHVGPADSGNGFYGSYYKSLYGQHYTLSEPLSARNAKASTVSDMDSLVAAVSAEPTTSQKAWCTFKSPTTCINDICYDKCQKKNEDGEFSDACKSCRLAEQIWGNCEFEPTTDLSEENAHNKIITGKNSDTETLLSWFAKNTGTSDNNESCRDTTCGPGFKSITINGAPQCVTLNNLSKQEERICPANNRIDINIVGDFQNCCQESDGTNTEAYKKDGFGNCCTTNTVRNVRFSEEIGYYPNNIPKPVEQSFCLMDTDKQLKFVTHYRNNNRTFNLFCLGTLKPNPVNDTKTDTFPNGTTITCDGNYIITEAKGTNYFYLTPTYDQITDEEQKLQIYNYINTAGYHVSGRSYCLYAGDGQTWKKYKRSNDGGSSINPDTDPFNQESTCPTHSSITHWQVQFGLPTPDSGGGDEGK